MYHKRDWHLHCQIYNNLIFTDVLLRFNSCRKYWYNLSVGWWLYICTKKKYFFSLVGKVMIICGGDWTSLKKPGSCRVHYEGPWSSARSKVSLRLNLLPKKRTRNFSKLQKFFFSFSDYFASFWSLIQALGVFFCFRYFLEVFNNFF